MQHGGDVSSEQSPLPAGTDAASHRKERDKLVRRTAEIKCASLYTRNTDVNMQ